MSSLVKTVPVELDRRRNMRLTLADCREFKRRTVTEERPEGISLLRGDLSHVELAEDEWLELFHVTLRHEDDELTVDALAEVVDMAGFVRLAEAFEDLLSDFGAVGEASAAPDPTPSAATQA